MSHIAISLLAFLVAIAILVPFHEFGHFWVARKLGVKVQRFAIGFGKILFSRRAKDGVEYCICAIPLGGYVKMLDEREGKVPEEDLPYAFNRQSVWKRFLIVLAGPVFNIVLAFLLCIVVFRIGFEGSIPVLSNPVVDSPAAKNGLKAHDEILAIDGHATPTVVNVHHVWQEYLDEPAVTLTILRQGKTQAIDFKQPEISPAPDTDFLKMLGVEFKLPPVLGHITPDSPAMKAGLLEGDKITQINGTAVDDWDDLVAQIGPHAHTEIKFTIERDGKHKTLTVTPDARPDGTGMIGAHLPKGLFRQGSFSWGDSVTESFGQTYKMMALNLKMIGQMVTGHASIDNISGPVTIARVAGETVERGVAPYLYFLALISVGLAVLNLLPVPMLDGGHLLFYMIEIVLRRPLSERVQEICYRIGILLLLGLMLIALYNDMMHVVS
jgi:regulator of sigma E protease